MADKPRDVTPTAERRPAGRGGEPATTSSSRTEIDAFLAKVKSLGPATGAGQRGRLIFALDATMSRQPLWDTACQLQADMFREAAAIGGLDVQLVYYRGLAECRASRWVSQAERLAELMARIDCRGGHTQIGKVLAHARARDRAQEGAGAGVRRRRHGGEARRSVPGGRRTRPARRAGLHVPGGRRRRSPNRRSARSRG